MQAAGLITFVKNEIAKDVDPATLMSLAERVAWARVRRGLTQSQLAKAAHVKQGTIGNIESGARKKPQNLLALAEALQVSPHWLENGKGPWELAESGQAEPTPARRKGEVFEALSTDEQELIRLWRDMRPSDHKVKLQELAELAVLGREDRKVYMVEIDRIKERAMHEFRGRASTTSAKPQLRAKNFDPAVEPQLADMPPHDKHPDEE